MKISDIRLKKLGPNVYLTFIGKDIFVTSYDSVVAHIRDKELIAVGPKWNFSKTTYRHMTQAFGFLEMFDLRDMTYEERYEHFKQFKEEEN